MLGKIYEDMKEHYNAVEAYKTASTYISPDLLNYLIKSKDPILKLLFEVFYRIATQTLQYPNHNTREVLFYLDISWRIVDCLNNNYEKSHVANTYIAIGIYTKNNELKTKWQKILHEIEQKQGHLNPFVDRLRKIEGDFTEENANERIKELIDLAEDGIKSKMMEFSASIYGQIIYHYRLTKSLNLEDGIQYGQKALDILIPMFGEKHFVVRNVYLSLSDTYKRLGDEKKASEYLEKQENAEYLLGLK